MRWANAVGAALAAYIVAEHSLLLFEFTSTVIGGDNVKTSQTNLFVCLFL